MKHTGIVLAFCLISTRVPAADGNLGGFMARPGAGHAALITQRLQALQKSGKWDQEMEAFKGRVIENSQRPAPVGG
jgi:conjugal transfer pilus assembly protein TraW